MKYRNIAILGGALAGMISGGVIAFVNISSSQQEDSRSMAAMSEQLRPPTETFNPVFEPCAHCHQIGKGARNSSGPVLTGIVGKPAAATPYPYSAALRESGLIWDETTLRAFIRNPHQLVPKTRMAFAGLPEEKIDSLIEFLRSVPDDQ